MSLINYMEPIDIFGGLSKLIMAIMLAYILWVCTKKLIAILDVSYRRAVKYELVEEVYLDNYAKKLGIDLDQELVRKKVFEEDKPKNLQKKLQEKIYEDFFKEDKVS